LCPSNSSNFPHGSKHCVSVIMFERTLEHDKLWQPRETKIINGSPVTFMNVVVKTIRIGDVDDPDLMVAEPIWQWQQSDEGQFVMANAVDKPYWVRDWNEMRYGYRYKIVARMKESDIVYWKLRWDQT